MTIIAINSSDTENVVSTTEWTEVINKEFTLNDTGDYVMFISCEYTNAATNYIAGLRVVVDGVERSFHHQSPVIANQYMTFSTIVLITLDAGLHALSIEARTSNVTSATTIRRNRLVVMKH